MSRFGCAICSEALDENRDISATKCGHVFHGNCLQQWLASNATCPHCRTSIRLARDVISKIFFTNHDDTVCMTPSSSSNPARSNDEIARLKEKCNRMKRQKAEGKDENLKLQGQLKIANSVSASLEAELKNQEADNKTMKADLKLQQSEVRKLQKQNSITTMENAKLRSSLNELQQLRTMLHGKEEEVHALLKSYGVSHADNQPAVQLAQYCAELKSQLQSQMTEKTKLMKQVALAYQQKTSSENEVISLKARINKLIEIVEQMRSMGKPNSRPKRDSPSRFCFDCATLNRVHSSPRQISNSTISNGSEDAEISDELYSQEEAKSDTACALVKPSKSSYKFPILSSNGSNAASITQSYDEYKIFKKSGLGKLGPVKKPRMDEFYNGLGGHSGPSDFEYFKQRMSSPNHAKKFVKPSKMSIMPFLVMPTVIHVSDSDTD